MGTLTEFAHLFGESWVQNVILAISAIVAIWTIKSSSKQEKQRATVDVVRDQTRDDQLRTSREIFRRLRDGNQDIGACVAQQTSVEFLAVRDVLNAYEFMASGVKVSAFDEDTYQRMYNTNVVRDWKLLEDFVRLYRSQRGPTLYQDFEWLALRWQSKPLKKNPPLR